MWCVEVGGVLNMSSGWKCLGVCGALQCTHLSTFEWLLVGVKSKAHGDTVHAMHAVMDALDIHCAGHTPVAHAAPPQRKALRHGLNS